MLVACIDFFAVAAWTEPGMKIDPGQTRPRASVRAQDLAQRAVAPRRLATAVEHAIGKCILAAAHRGLVRLVTVLRDPRLELRLILGTRRPTVGQQQRVDLGIR